MPASTMPLGPLLLLLIVVALVVSLIRRFRGKRPWNLRWFVSSPRVGTRLAGTAWFRQFDRLLAAQGLRRLPTQTRREFALLAGQRLSLADNAGELQQASQTLVDAYYQVRFGGQTLDPQQQRAVQQALRQLKARLPRRSLWRTLLRTTDGRTNTRTHIAG